MPASTSTSEPKRPRQPDDGTRQLLRWGGSMVGTGLLAIVLLLTLLGGYSRTGASTNAGWFALIVALMCIPFGTLLLTLGVAKWMRRARDQRSGIRDQNGRGQ